MDFKILLVCLLCQAEVIRCALQRRQYDGPALIGVASDKSLVGRDLGYDGAWVRDQSCCVTSVAVMQDGSLLGVGDDGSLYTKPGFGTGGWTGPVDNSCCVQDVAVMPDGSILGVTNAGKLATRPGITGGWTTVPKSLGVVRVDVLADGRIIGVSEAGSLKIRGGVSGTWSRMASMAFSAADISIQPDGTILGISQTSCGVYVYDASTGRWSAELPDSQCVISIVSPGNLANLETPKTTPVPTVAPTVAPTEAPEVFAILGVGSNLNVYKRAEIEGTWIGPLRESCCVSSITTLTDGTVVGIGIDNYLYTKSPSGLNEPWQGPVANSCCVKDVTVMPDGTIVGIGMGNQMWTRPAVEGTWSGPVAGSCCVQSISPLPSGGVLGVGMGGKLWVRPGVQGAWTNVDTDGVVSDISVGGDGRVIGIGGTCGLWQRTAYDSHNWLGEIASSRCVKSVSFMRNAQVSNWQTSYSNAAPTYGVGSNYQVYRRNDIEGTWVGPLENSCCVIAITTLYDGSVVGVGHDNYLYTKSSTNPNEPWQGPVANSCCVKDVTVMPDGTIVGIGMGNQMWTRPAVEGTWSGPVAGSCCVQSISPLPAAGVLGVGMGGKLWIRPGIQGAWSKVDDDGIVSDVSINRDGRVIGIGTSCGLWQRSFYDSHNWLGEIATSRCVRSVSFIRTAPQVSWNLAGGTLPAPVYGVGSNYHVYKRNDIEGTWVGPLENSCCVIAITTLYDGSVVGVGHDNYLYTKSSTNPNEPWQGPVANSCCVKDVTVMPDGTIVGIGMGNQMWTRPSVEGTWSGPVGASCCVQSISPLPTGAVLGVGMGGKLWVRPRLDGSWTNVDTDGVVSDVSVNDDGRVIGIGGSCGLWQRSFYDSHHWLGEISNSQCVRSVSFIRSAPQVSWNTAGETLPASVYGVGSNFKVYRRNDIEGTWVGPLENSCCVIAITTLYDGSVVGVGHDNYLYTKSSTNPNEPWQGPVANSCCVKDVTVMADGTIVGIGMGNQMWTRPAVEGTWSGPVGASCCVQSISPLPATGGVLGVGMGGKLWVRPRLDGSWTNVDTDGVVSDVSVNDDGRVIGIGGSCGLWQRSFYDSHHWLGEISNSQCVRSVSFIRSASQGSWDVESTSPAPVYGIGTDNQLWKRDDIEGTWTGPIPNSCCVIALTTLADKTIVGVGTGNQLWTKSSEDAAWVGPVANSCCVKDVTVMPDGTIVGIGMGNQMWTRPSVEGTWSGPVAGSCCVKSISPMPSGGIIGVGMGGKLWVRPRIEGTWTNVDDNGVVSDVSINEDGVVIGIGTTCGLWQRPQYNTAWVGEIANSRCVKSVAFIK